MSMHPAARRGFGSVPEIYETSRPEYPAEAIRWLATTLGIGAGATVVDLAAGTGKLTRQLLVTGADVIAIEPVDEMRDLLMELAPTAEARAGTAEATGLADRCAAAVTVAQAFHWFDGPAALTEIHRILRPGGSLALFWNVRDFANLTQRAVEDLFVLYRGATPAHRNGRWRRTFDDTDLFRSVARREFANVDTFDADRLVDRVASTSFIADLPPPDRTSVLERARAIADGLPPTFPFPYTTEVEVFARR
jgi:SAM-dependent methyltransferase